MSRTWRLLVEDGVGAAEGLALDEALMGRYARGEPERPPTLRLYSYRDHCALIGRYQNIDAEIDLAACRRTGTEVNRRLSGGGAIVMGSGQLGIAYFDRAETDLEVGGRKIAGLGLYVDQAGAMLFHASVLADLDVAFMLQVLRIPAAKLADRATASVTERLTTVSAETGVAHDATTLRPVIAAGFAAAFGIVLQPGTPEGPERALAQALEAARYRSESWLNERSAAGDAGGTALLKTPAGLARIYLSTHGDLIKSAMVVGDFNELPPCVVAMESELRWRRLDHDAIFAVVTGSGAADALGVEPELLAGAVIEAGRESRERSVALAFRASDPDSRPRPG
jgi:lipoate-protein ligase A